MKEARDASVAKADMKLKPLSSQSRMLVAQGSFTPSLEYHLCGISLGILLIIGLFTRPAAFIAFLFLGSLWISELGASWIWELLVPVLASLGLAVGRGGRAWGVDALLSRRNPSSLWW